MENVAFYLKINQDTRRAISYLNYWIEAALLHGGDCYVLCDKEELVMKIKESLLLSGAVKFIKSNRTGMNARIMSGFPKIENNFLYAGYAHLTAFSHANECEYESFWNIDADDTEICLSAERSAELLLCAESYAQEHGFDCFSLDMHCSRCRGKHWSFGVTYVKNRRDWFDLMYRHISDEAYIDRSVEIKFNLDWYFTYLSTCQELKIRTFYFENLKFIHDTSEGVFVAFPLWGMFHFLGKS